MLTVTTLFEWFGDIGIDTSEQDKSNEPMILQKQYDKFGNTMSNFWDSVSHQLDKPLYYPVAGLLKNHSGGLAHFLANYQYPGSPFYGGDEEEIRNMIESGGAQWLQSNEFLNKSASQLGMDALNGTVNMGVGLANLVKEHPTEAAIMLAKRLPYTRQAYWIGKIANAAYNFPEYADRYGQWISDIDEMGKNAAPPSLEQTARMAGRMIQNRIPGANDFINSVPPDVMDKVRSGTLPDGKDITGIVAKIATEKYPGAAAVVNNIPPDVLNKIGSKDDPLNYADVARGVAGVASAKVPQLGTIINNLPPEMMDKLESKPVSIPTSLPKIPDYIPNSLPKIPDSIPTSLPKNPDSGNLGNMMSSAKDQISSGIQSAQPEGDSNSFGSIANSIGSGANATSSNPEPSPMPDENIWV